jgi:hypothetical protein
VENYERRNSRQFAALCEEVLGEGFAVRFRVSGTSMMPNIVEDDDVGGGPAAIDEIANGDAVPCKPPVCSANTAPWASTRGTK